MAKAVASALAVANGASTSSSTPAAPVEERPVDDPEYDPSFEAMLNAQLQHTPCEDDDVQITGVKAPPSLGPAAASPALLPASPMQRPLTLGVLMQRLQALGSRGLPLSTILDLSSLGCDDVPFASRGTHGGESPWTPPLLAGSSSSAALGGRLPPSSVVGRSMASSGNVSLYRGGLLAPVLASPRAVPAKSAGSSSPGSRFFRALLVSHPITDTILSAVELHAYAASDIFEHDFMAHKRHRPQLLADHIRDMASNGDTAAGDFYDHALLAPPLITTPVTLQPRQ
mmetsp:Transcript_3867/g.5910  ORF Transcript_3867/g.5910 Transcript_3867/m.5910 type:complete len:285 (+) Transcript_3867:589-1443(+)